MTGIADSASLGRVGEVARPGLARRFLRRKSFLLGSTALAIIGLVALLAPVLAPHDPLKQDLARSLWPPVWVDGGSPEHLLGTDALGRDVLSRIMFGARNSLLIAFLAVLIASVLGLAAGLVAGFSRGWPDALLMRLGDMQLAFPFILLAIIVLGVSSERSILHLVLVLGIPGWILYARVVRSRVLAERDKDYVTAARAIGAGNLRQIRKYLLPSVWQVVLVIALLDLGFVILIESTLSFLGFGLAPPTPSWGSILAEGRRNMSIAPWLAVLPGLAILVTVLAVNLTADGTADVLDPRLRKGTFRRLRLKGTSGREPVEPRPEPSEAPHAPAAAALPDGALLQVRDLRVEFPFDDRVVRAVRGVDFEVRRGQTVGIVGESGSGKSVTALSLIQLLDAPGRVTGGRILFEDMDLTRIDDGRMAALRGTRLGMIFQNPGASLNPVMSVGDQMRETIRQHRRASARQATELAAQALKDIGIGDPERVLSRYPFQLSGGMNQRVMIGMAMLSRPDLLIADEPTTALDVTTQAQVLEQLVAVTREHHTALILITHDIALVSEYVDHVIVVYAGRVAESGPVRDVIRQPRHPYTQALLDSVARVDLPPGARLRAIPGELPDPSQATVGCPFAPRCAYVMDVCRTVDPPLEPAAPGWAKACHLEAPPATLPPPDQPNHPGGPGGSAEPVAVR
ncbi:dipeptide/oligopeptide/nickel ABC transporter permease/ATP-binding protein [soil metagenome]